MARIRSTTPCTSTPRFTRHLKMKSWVWYWSSRKEVMEINHVNWSLLNAALSVWHALEANTCTSLAVIGYPRGSTPRTPRKSFWLFREKKWCGSWTNASSKSRKRSFRSNGTQCEAKINGNVESGRFGATGVSVRPKSMEMTRATVVAWRWKAQVRKYLNRSNTTTKRCVSWQYWPWTP